MAVFNHVGQCVRDLGRARRFYEDVFGFEFWREISPPDDPSGRLLRLRAPLGMRACYLRREGFVLELLAFEGSGTSAHVGETRAMNHVGLTHLSLSVEDLAATCRAVEAHGGAVLEDTDIGSGVFVRDPDGQLVELLPMAYRDSLPD